MKKATETYTCDSCGKTETYDPSTLYIGSSPIGGWYTISRTNKSTQVIHLREAFAGHTCSSVCAKELIDKHLHP